MALIDLIYIKTLKVKPAVSQLLEEQFNVVIIMQD